MKSFSILRRSTIFAAAAALIIGVLSPVVVLPQSAHAFPTGGQLEPRAIQMSNSEVGATGVSYNIQFAPAENYTMKGLLVNFCDGESDPIIGDSTCTTTGLTGFNVGATPTINTTPALPAQPAPQSYTYTDLGGTWTTSSVATSGVNNIFKMTDASGVALTTGHIYDFTITGVANTTSYDSSSHGTFYARIVTYQSATGDIASYTPTTPGSTDAEDYGGIALAMTNSIAITAKIQEKLTFCITGTADFSNINCAGAASTALTIGHTSGGTVATIDNTAVDTASVWTQLSTNATNGVIVRMTNSNACAGLSDNGGTTCNIPPIGATAAAITAGTADFGAQASNTITGEIWTHTGTVSPIAPYNSTTDYGMDNTGGATPTNPSVSSTYGSPILESSGPLSSVDNDITFAATASNTTPAGLYTANMALIATGFF